MIVIVIANMVLFGLGIFGPLIFWGIIIAAAVFSYKVLPNL